MSRQAFRPVPGHFSRAPMMRPRAVEHADGFPVARPGAYAVAVASVAGVAVARPVLNPVLADTSPFLLFTLAVAVSGYVGGFRPALLATALGAAAGAGLFQRWDDHATIEALRLGLFAAVGVVLGGLCGGLHAHRQAAEAEVARRRTAEAGLARAKQQDEAAEARAAAELRASEERFHALADAVPQIVYVTRADGSHEFLNRRWREYTGRDTCTPDDLAAVAHPDDRAGPAARWEAARAAGEPFTAEFRLRGADGAYRWFLTRAVPVRGADGRVERWFGTSTDIDDRKRAEADIARLNGELARRVRELQAVFDAAPVGINVATDPGCREILGNRALADMLGMATGENVSKSGADADRLPYRVLRDGREVPADDLPMQRAARTGAAVADEVYEFVRADGSRVTVLVTAVPVRDAAGAVTGAVGVCADVTALYRAEQALRDADRRKDAFLAVLGHELRNPLAPIRNAVEALRAVRLADPAAVRQRDVIDRQVRHLARLVDDLLDVSRITHGKVRVRPVPLDLRAAVGQGVETARPQVDARRHKLAVVLPADPVPVDGDADRLAQVVANLLNNAAKYTPDGGDVTVTVAAADGWAEVRVRDTGAGFAPDQLESVFVPFAQLTHSLERSHGGLGVGLALVRTLVELHGGTVAAASDGPGRGAAFVVRLPLTAAPLPPAAPPPGPDARAGRRVLVVDDNADAADSLSFLLEMFGHQVRTAHDGPAGLAAAAEFRPDVVFLDLGMPGMDGYQVAARLRGDPALSGVTLVALTGWGHDDDRRRTREAGFDHHLVKPVDADELRQLLAGGPAACRV